MPTTFYQLWNRLTGDVGSDLPTPKAKQIIQQAWRTVLNSRPWSFLLREGVIVAPALVTGNVTFTQYSPVAVPDAALLAILNALTGPAFITRRSLRLASSSGAAVTTNNPIYDIYGFDGAQLTLNRIYQETSGLKSVNIFRRFFLPPYDALGQETTDFQRFLQVIDADNNWPLDTSKPKRMLDFWDPNRSASGNTPFALCEAPAADINFPGVSFDGNLQPGSPLYELYPHYYGSTQKTYKCVYQAYGANFTDDRGSVTSVLPPYIDEDLILEQARIDAYRWAESNKGRVPSLQKTNWLGLMESAGKLYTIKFLEARRVDEEHYRQNFVPKLSRPYNRRGFSGGADYLQTHSFPAWWGTGY